MIDRELTPDIIDAIFTDGPINDLRVLPVALSMDPPDNVDVERICLDLAFHKDAWVRGNALTAFGHLARVLRKLDQQGPIKRILEASLSDEEPIVSGRAGDAISDIEIFLGWSFRNKEPTPRPRVPRNISTTACYRTYLLLDEDSHILVERAAPLSNSFAPDPRGLSSDNEWRLPGFSLTGPLSDAGQALDERWAMRFPKVWANQSNRFEEVAVVQCLTSPSDCEHKYRDWVELRCRAYLTDRSDNPWLPGEETEQRWIAVEEFMADYPVGGHDRYVLTLFDSHFSQETGTTFF